MRTVKTLMVRALAAGIASMMTIASSAARITSSVSCPRRGRGASACTADPGDGTSIVLNADGTRTVTADGQSFTVGDRDFNVRSLRTNVVMRWEWRPGSTMFVVWQQDSEADRRVCRVRPGDLFDAFGTAADNFFAIKVSYWIPLR